MYVLEYLIYHLRPYGMHQKLVSAEGRSNSSFLPNPAVNSTGLRLISIGGNQVADDARDSFSPPVDQILTPLKRKARNHVKYSPVGIDEASYVYKEVDKRGRT